MKSQEPKNKVQEGKAKIQGTRYKEQEAKHNISCNLELQNYRTLNKLKTREFIFQKLNHFLPRLQY